MKRLVSYVLLVVLIISFTCIVSGEEATETIDLFNPASLEGAAGNRAITGTETIAIAITISDSKEWVSFTSVEQPSYGEMPIAFTWSVYKWDTDYDTSIKEINRVFTKRETNYIQYKNLTYTFDEPLIAGKYVIVLSDPELESTGGNVGVFCHKGKEGVDVYFSGTLQSDTALRAKITIQNATPKTEPNTPTGDISVLGYFVLVLLSATGLKKRKILVT